MNVSNKWSDIVLDNWKKFGIKLNSGLSVSQIQSAEQILKFQFPQDFIELYQKVNGFRDSDWNKHMFSFWPLEKIVEEYKRDETSDFVGFCDF